MITNECNPSDELKLEIVPFGPNQETINRIATHAMGDNSVKKFLEGTRNRLLWFELIDTDNEVKNIDDETPTHFRITFYDYTNNRTIFVKGSVEQDKPKILGIEESNLQPLPNQEEFEEALNILRQNDKVGHLIGDQIYPPMPPLLNNELPDGTIQRTINIGLLPDTNELEHEIVGVNMIDRCVVRFENRAPSNSMAGDLTCGLPYANQSTARGVAGQVWPGVSRLA